MLKIGRNMYWKRTAWAPKARRPTLKTAHLRPSSLTIWSNHFLYSLFFQCSNLFNFQILLFVPIDQVLHQFCGATPPSLMVLFFSSFPYIRCDILSLTVSRNPIFTSLVFFPMEFKISQIGFSKFQYMKSEFAFTQKKAIPKISFLVRFFQ